MEKGIVCYHLNIRSLRNKVSEVKAIINEHRPHIMGLSECELIRGAANCEDASLKIPGYDILFPSSWTLHGYARAVLYVKKSLQYEQLSDLQNEHVQSIWLRGGFRNTKRLYFCNYYREHKSKLGSSIDDQKKYLDLFLNQWEAAAYHKNSQGNNEVYLFGDMNLDALNGRWLQPNYSLLSLSTMVQNSCNVGNFSQLVSFPTRFQLNSVSGVTEQSCIDHIYSNYSFRCSNPIIWSFGASDHDIIGFTRFSKEPSIQTKTVRKRSYKKFNTEKFLTEISSIDWIDVYLSRDLDQAVEAFVSKFREVLNNNAEWIIFQERKSHAPWITEDTLNLMKMRDSSKKEAVQLARQGRDSTEAWEKFKKLRNKVNNRTKYEERNFKASQIENSLDSMSKVWKLSKQYMNWNSSSGPPQQLCVEGCIVTKAAQIANVMNDFFIKKVRVIQDSISHAVNNFDECKRIMVAKNCRLSMQYVSLSKVNKLLKSLKPSRSTSMDSLDNYCVRLAADFIDKPLHHIITLSIQP